MLPGPNYVYECPKCKYLLYSRSIGSGNTFGAKMFSDGKRIALMLPEFPDLTKCPKCNAMFWLSKMKEIGTYGMNDKLAYEKWAMAEEVEFLTIYEYQIALEGEVYSSQDEELFIRQRIWWGFNDRVRKGKNIFSSDKDEVLWKNNALKLLALFDIENLNHKIMVAELHRNLGDFEKCMEIINSIKDSNLNSLKLLFEKECLSGNRNVFQVF